MKKKILSVLSLAALFITGCSCTEIEKENHLHTFDSEFKSDDDFHWRQATCGHDVKKDFGPHDFGETLKKEDGSEYEICKTCGYVKVIEPSYTFYQKYKYDDEFHWQEAIGYPDIKRNFGEHEYGDEKIDAVGEHYRQCNVCRYKKYGENEDYFLSVTEFADEVEIHTEYQKQFLSYTDNTYDKMPRNSYPDGSKNISDPTSTKIYWRFSKHNSDIKYKISISQNQDMTNSFEIMGDNKQEIDAYNFYLGDNYYRIIATDSNGDIYSSKVYKLTVSGAAPRNLYVGARMTNCRDMGGRVLSSGGKIKQGLLYRTCGNGYNQDGKKIDDEGKDILLNQLKVKTELNLHNNSSYDFKLDGTKVYATLMDYADGSPSKHHFSRNAESVKNIFEILAKEESYPAYYHCRIGTDRTGLIAILLNGVLGVSLNDIYQDYLFSNFGKIGSKRNIGEESADDISSYMSEILAMPGQNFQEKVYNTLLTIGVPRTTIKKIVDILVEGDKPVFDLNQLIMSDMDVSFSGTTLQSCSHSNLTEREYPSLYCILKAGCNVTFSFPIKPSADKVAYLYVGNNDASTTKKINTSISAKIDGKSITIPSITFKDAGMGYCNGNRINYYFVKLGELGSLSTGDHSLVITGVANDLVLGNIAIF